MSILLIVVAVLVGLFAFGTLGLAKTSIHEIQGFVLLLIAAVLFVGGCILSEIERIRRRLKQAFPDKPADVPIVATPVADAEVQNMQARGNQLAEKFGSKYRT